MVKSHHFTRLDAAGKSFSSRAILRLSYEILLWGSSLNNADNKSIMTKANKITEPDRVPTRSADKFILHFKLQKSTVYFTRLFQTSLNTGYQPRRHESHRRHAYFSYVRASNIDILQTQSINYFDLFKENYRESFPRCLGKIRV